MHCVDALDLTLEKLDANGNPVKEKKFRGDVDGPGREARGQIIKKEKNHTGSVTSTPQTGPKRMYKMGDADLRLDVANYAVESVSRPT